MDETLLRPHNDMGSISGEISVVRYSGGVVDRTVDELKEADRKTIKLPTLNGALHPRYNAYNLPRAEGQAGV